MKKSAIIATVAVGVLVIAAPVEARHHHHRVSQVHGNCLRFDKTTGSVAGAVGGGVLGKVAFGSPVGVLAGAAAGGLAGHELSRNGRKRC